MAIEDQDQGDMIRVPLGQTVIIPRQRYDQLQADVAALKAYARAVEALCDQHGCEAWEIGMELQRHPRAAALLDQEEDG